MRSELLLLAALALPEPASPPTEAHVALPRWDPQGQSLAYALVDHQELRGELWLLPPAGAPSRVRPISRSSAARGFEGGRPAVAEGLAWDPRRPGRHVYAATAEDGDLELFLSPSTRLTASPGADGDPSWSPDGRHIAFASARSGQSELYLLDLEAPTAPPRRLTHSAPGVSALDPQISPDGRRLAYISAGPEGEHVVLISELLRPGAPATRLTSGRGQHSRPRWSRDGQGLAWYLHEAPGASPRIQVWQGPTLQVAVVADRGGPCWDLDGRGFYAVQDDQARLDPVVWLGLQQELRHVPTGTLGNADLDITRRGGETWLAVAAQGAEGGGRRDFRRLYRVLLR